MVIYIIEFLDTDYFYIGSSINYKAREYKHIGDLNRNVHVNPKMQNVFNKYPDKFIMRKIDTAETHEDLLNLEQAYIDTFNPPLNMSKNVRYPTGNRPANVYEVMNNEGLILTVNNALVFCKEHNIDFTEFYKVARAERCSCRSWKVVSVNGVKITPRINKTTTQEYKERRKEVIKIMQASVTKEHREKQSINASKKYLITTPDKIQFCVIGLNWFCKQKSLDVSNLAKVAQGKAKQYKGYLCEEI